eukprot:GDKJ01015296.1.p1 GENE.GDKJ01015296.1~~GDKJ01015296.1.p1  ORF type:complete len:231 (-),score=39.99 GDKJ01015296.1:36-695(-)
MTNKAARGERLRLPVESPAIISAPHGVTIGVDRSVFERLIVAYQAAGYPSTTVTSETAAFNDGERIEKDGSGKIVSYIKKRKLTTIDLVVPGAPLDLRIGVATESPQDLAKAPAIPSDAFIRQRNRTSFTVPHNITVDFTIIGGNTNRPIYEVEAEVTFAKLEADGFWVADLLQEAQKLLELAKRPKAVVAPPAAKVEPVVAANTTTAEPAMPAADEKK